MKNKKESHDERLIRGGNNALGVFNMKKPCRTIGIPLILATLFLLAFSGRASFSADNVLVLATTTSTQDTGLLDEILPVFERENKCRVKVIAVGSGAAIRMGRDGDADVLLVHDPAAEKAAVKAGFVVNRRYVMYNDFVLVGPASDPAGIRGSGDAVGAFRKIAAVGTVFVSRGDRSGTHTKELSLWKKAGIQPKGSAWYLEAGSGMAATLRVASEKKACCLTDRATWLSLKKKLDLALLLEKDSLLFNPYHVMAVSPGVHPEVNNTLAEKFISFLLSPPVRKTIGQFGLDKYGERLFYPAPPGEK